jgi:hypothetical protein
MSFSSPFEIVSRSHGSDRHINNATLIGLFGSNSSNIAIPFIQVDMTDCAVQTSLLAIAFTVFFGIAATISVVFITAFGISMTDLAATLRLPFCVFIYLLRVADTLLILFAIFVTCSHLLDILTSNMLHFYTYRLLPILIFLFQATHY